MNELETLNMLLRLIGSSPVNNINTPHPDAANGRTTMDRIRRRAQRKGWWFNIEYDVLLYPDQLGRVTVPATYSSVVLADTALVQRGNQIFNKYKQTGVFTDNVVVTRAVNTLDWDSMPDLMQEYCAYLAASEFVRDELEDPQKEASLKESAAISMLDLKKQELEEGQYNVFNKPRVVRARGGIQPYSRSRVRFFGDPDR